MLIFAAFIDRVVAVQMMVVNLADFHIWVDDQGLNHKNLQRPKPAKTNITKSSSHMDKHSQSSNAAAPLKHGDELVRAGMFYGSSQI